VTASQGGNGSYNPAVPVSQSFTIYKAVASCPVTGYNVTYDTHPHTASGTCTGVFSEVLTGLDLTNTTHTNVNDDFSSDSWSYPGDADYNSASGPVTDSISKASGCSISGWTGAYDGNPHGATGSCQGTGTLDKGASYTNVSGGTASWTYTGDANYNGDGGIVTITISKANSGCSISGWTGTYNGNPHGATGSCQGTGTLDKGASYTNVPGGTASWTYTGDANYNGDGGIVTITISKANSGCSISGWTGTYDGNPHGASGSCQGTGTLDLGASYTDVPGGDASWSYTGDANYNSDGGTVTITINN
jgi:hypothetical protein